MDRRPCIKIFCDIKKSLQISVTVCGGEIIWTARETFVYSYRLKKERNDLIRGTERHSVLVKSFTNTEVSVAV